MARIRRVIGPSSPPPPPPPPAPPPAPPPPTGSCFLAGTLVTMADASVCPVDRVRVGDHVMGVDGRANEVIALERAIVGPRYAMYAINGAFMCVGGHPMLTIEGWKSCDAAQYKGINDGQRHSVILDPEAGVGATMTYHGLARIGTLAVGDKVVGIRPTVTPVASIERIAMPFETQLFNLVCGGTRSACYQGIYTMSAWATDRGPDAVDYMTLLKEFRDG